MFHIFIHGLGDRSERTLRKLASNRKLGGIADMPPLPSRGTLAGWRNGQTRSSLKFRKGNAKLCSWAGIIPGNRQYTLEADQDQKATLQTRTSLLVENNFG